MNNNNKSNVTVRLVKSLIGKKEKHRKIIQGLGLRKINNTSILQDTPSLRGMLSKVAYLVKVD